jgi:hypothetical protein
MIQHSTVDKDNYCINHSINKKIYISCHISKTVRMNYLEWTPRGVCSKLVYPFEFDNGLPCWKNWQVSSLSVQLQPLILV